jgi:threonine dehydrogenase-like Zn-dependent dehydrogenase
MGSVARKGVGEHAQSRACGYCSGSRRDHCDVCAAACFNAGMALNQDGAFAAPFHFQATRALRRARSTDKQIALLETFADQAAIAKFYAE